jgi:hypothetical protein
MRKLLSIGMVLFVAGCINVVSAQSRRTKKAPKPAPATTPVTKTTPHPTPAQSVPGKRNGRPGSDPVNAGGSTVRALEPNYFYEFHRPGFSYSRILIEHDTSGNGRVSFERDGADELFTDPLHLSAATLQNINEALGKLDFLTSTEVYQAARDYSTMGNVTFTYKSGGRERTVKYNWTDNKDAKSLMDEYRRIGNEYTWKFEISVARENQPLQTPGLMDQMDSYLTRGEISDPPHLVPLLTELSNDERLPLIARNHASKLIKFLIKR